MKKLLLLLLVFTSVVNNAQTTLFEDSFEDYEDFAINNVGNWIMLDLDGKNPLSVGGWNNNATPQAFIVFNPSVAATTNIIFGIADNHKPRTGQKYAGCWKNKMGEVNDDWMISPTIDLGASSNKLSFWIRSFSDLYGLENYEVGIYTGSATPVASSDFVIISGETPLEAQAYEWEEKTFNLDAFANQTVRIGIHYVSKNKHFMSVDDFKVTTGTLETKDFLAGNFTVFPNPAKEVLHIMTKNGTEIKGIQVLDLNGRIVKTLRVEIATEALINVDDLTSGAYFVTIQTKEGNTISRFLKN